MKKYRLKGKNIDALLKKAEKHFKISKNKIKYKIVREEKGLLGQIKEIEILIWFDEEKEDKSSEKKPEEKKETKEKKDDEIEQPTESKNEKDEEEEKIEDYFEIQAQKEGILLRVDNEIDKFGLDNAEIFEKLTRLDIKKPNIFKMREALTTKRGKFVKVAEYDANFYKDAVIQIEVVKKRLEAVARVKPPDKGNHVNYAMIKEKIEKMAIKYGIDEDAIQKIEDERIYNETVTVARGTPPKHGKHAEIVFYFDLGRDKKLEEDESGNIDYKNIGIINNIKTGEKIARKDPATKGDQGIDVFGNSVTQKPGKDKKFSYGKNVELDKDGLFLVAKIDGQVVANDKKINVLPVYQVNTNVDYSTGNIDFVGTVYINGNVNEGFKVKAAGDIIINGLVEDAFLESGGNISVRNGLIGKEGGKGKIIAKGDITAKFIEHIKVEAGRDIIADKVILYSNIKAERFIKSKKGKIIGGNLLAGAEIIANKVGSEYGNLCSLEVGILPKTKEKFLELKDKYIELSQKEETLTKETKTLKGMQKTGNLSKNREATLFDKTKELFQIKKEIIEKENEIKELEDIIKRSKKGKIHIIDVVTEDVVLKIGEYKLSIKEKFKYTTFYINESRREIGILPCEVGE